MINYVRALGSGLVQPGQHMGGDPFDPALEQVQRNDMMALAVEQGVITQFEADIFDQVHTAMDEFLVGEGALRYEHRPTGRRTGADSGCNGRWAIGDSRTGEYFYRCS